MKYCTMPFTTLHFNPNHYSVCCYMNNNGYIKKNPNSTNDINNLISNPTLIDVRNSILNGTYKYCNSRCPTLQKIDRIPISNDIEVNITEVVFSSDDSCNLKCPSCRNDYIIRKSNHDLLTSELNFLYEIGNTITDISFSGSGETLMSKPTVNFLKEFDSSKFPNLQRIAIPTNGNLFTENMWNSISTNIPSNVNIDIRVSIDAATKETYDSVRVGGNFDILNKNLLFLQKIRQQNIIKKLIYNFIIQSNNINELIDFIIIHSANNIDAICISEISQWGHINATTFKLMSKFVKNQTYMKLINLLPNMVNNTSIEYEGVYYDIRGVYKNLLDNTELAYLKKLINMLLLLDDTMLSNIEYISLNNPHINYQIPVICDKNYENIHDENYLKVILYDSSNVLNDCNLLHSHINNEIVINFNDDYNNTSEVKSTNNTISQNDIVFHRAEMIKRRRLGM